MNEIPQPQSSNGPAPRNPLQKVWAGLLSFVAVTWKFIYPVLKLAKGGKLLLTAGSMLLSVWFYAQRFGFWFALGFVVCILIHEMGHVFAAWRIGLPVSAPIFIPGFGALILAKSGVRSAWEGAVMGYGGPLFGGLTALACFGIYGATGNAFFLGLAFVGFIMNLFNMIPIFPLDGGWITGAVSPYIWVAGMVTMVGLQVAGVVNNPLIWVLLLLSLPRIVSAFKRGTADETAVRTTPRQRTIAGAAYVGLCLFLAWGVAETHEGTVPHRARHSTVVQ